MRSTTTAQGRDLARTVPVAAVHQDGGGLGAGEANGDVVGRQDQRQRPDSEKERKERKEGRKEDDG